MSVTRHASDRVDRRIDGSLDLGFVQEMVERSLRFGTWVQSARYSGQVLLPVYREAQAGWLCGSFEKPFAETAERHVEILTSFGLNYAHVREALGSLADHPCPEEVLVREAEAVPYLGGPLPYLQQDLDRRFRRSSK